MTKMRCFCDHIISDSIDNLPYKAHVLPDEDVNGFVNPEVSRQMDFIAESIERWQRGEEQPGPFPRTYTSLSDLLKHSSPLPPTRLGARCTSAKTAGVSGLRQRRTGITGCPICRNSRNVASSDMTVYSPGRIESFWNRF